VRLKQQSPGKADDYVVDLLRLVDVTGLPTVLEAPEPAMSSAFGMVVILVTSGQFLVGPPVCVAEFSPERLGLSRVSLPRP
jgi:hypothetical protein